MARKLTAAQLRNKKIITPQQSIVLAELRKRPRYNRALSFITDLPINVITPRVHELRKLGLVEAKGRTKDYGTNRTVTVWTA